VSLSDKGTGAGGVESPFELIGPGIFSSYKNLVRGRDIQQYNPGTAVIPAPSGIKRQTMTGIVLPPSFPGLSFGLRHSGNPETRRGKSVRLFERGYFGGPFLTLQSK